MTIETVAVDTVRIEPVTGHEPALWMIWDRWPAEAAVTRACESMVAHMDAADQPVHVLVDLRSNPNFPMRVTVMDVLEGPARHCKMGDWLVIGANRLAKVIGSVVSRVTRRENIRWYDTEEQTLAALDKLMNSSD